MTRDKPFILRTMDIDGNGGEGVVKIWCTEFVRMEMPEGKGVILDKEEVIQILGALIKAQEVVDGGDWIKALSNTGPA